MTSETMARIPHDGGSNPVREGETLVKLWFREGEGLTWHGDSDEACWTHYGNTGDIIAYAVTPERKPETVAELFTFASAPPEPVETLRDRVAMAAPPFGGSRETVMPPVSLSTCGTTAAKSDQRARKVKWSAPANTSSCAQIAAALPLFGDIHGIDATDKPASSARYSATKRNRSARSLSERLTPLLISSGLVRGTTPLSVRQTCGLAIRDFALLPLTGGDAEPQRKGCSFSSGCLPAHDPHNPGATG